MLVSDDGDRLGDVEGGHVKLLSEAELAVGVHHVLTEHILGVAGPQHHWNLARIYIKLETYLVTTWQSHFKSQS